MVLVFRRNKKPNLKRNDADGNREMSEYQTRLGLLCDIAEEANSITQVSTLLERILKITQHTVDASIVSVFMKDEAKSRIHLPITVGRHEEEVRHQAIIIESEIADLVANSATPVLSNYVAADPRFSAEVQKNADTIIRSIIATPILKGQKVIGVLMAVNKDNDHGFTQRDFEVLKGFSATEALILLVSLERTAIENVDCLNLNQRQLEGYRNTVHELASAIDVKDAQVYAHARRTKAYAMLAANTLPLTPRELQAIEFGALLHDIGKIGINSEILCKPGPLNEEEWKIIHEHPQKGADILKDIPHLKDATNIVLCHHERYDGTGYPKKLKGDEIPIGARLVAVANAFDTMTTNNPYRAAKSKDEAIKELIDNTAMQFCPKAVEAFVAAFKKHQGNISVTVSPGETQPKEAPLSPVLVFDRFKNTENLIIRVKKEVKEAERLKRKAEKAVREVREKGKKAAKEARIRAVKEAKEAKIKVGEESREAKILKANEEKEAKEAKIKAEKETREAKILKAKADKEASGAKIKTEKETRQAEILKAKAEKEAKVAKIKAEKEAKIKAEIFKARAEKETREAKIQAEKEAKIKAEIFKARAEKETREAKIQAEKEAKIKAEIFKARAEKETREAKIIKSKVEKAAVEAKIKAEKEAKKATIEKTERETRQAEILKAKAEKAAVEAKIKTDKEAKIKAEILKAKAEKEAKEAKIKAEREARQSEILKAKAEKTAAEAKIRAENEAKIKTEILKARAEKEAKIKAEKEAREAKILKAKVEKEAKEARIKAKNQVKKSKKVEQPRKGNNHKVDAEILKGNVRLVVPINVSSGEVKAFGRDLEKLEGIKILMLSHSEEEGHLLLLGLQKPMNLTQLIKEMPQVESIDKKGGEILIDLRNGQS